ncbi:MAG: hypothetical protein DM484_08430 [Candidatus Methylumidiphilus alinenensis]|uniref:Uncharacterized protein n=1 Tax=Candidatus Methylumidiphilus alinenensis TaxID=2202197 RepID=A0A2W4TA43_9GAMM|nr:MAG: hypothetical protein DM484_08430 [Candidatus Methylumidiphilus alinenensis]
MEYLPSAGKTCNRSVPLPFPGNAAILAAISAGRMPRSQGSERLQKPRAGVSLERGYETYRRKPVIRFQLYAIIDYITMRIFNMLKLPCPKKAIVPSILGLTLALSSQFIAAEQASKPLVTIPPDVKQWLDSNNAKIILILDANGRLKSVGTDGKEFTSSQPKKAAQPKEQTFGAARPGQICWNGWCYP